MPNAHLGTARNALGAIDTLRMERCTACQTLCVDYHLSGVGCRHSCPCPLLSELYCPTCRPCCNDTAQLVLFKSNSNDGVAVCREQEEQA